MKSFPSFTNNQIKYLNTEPSRMKKKINLIFRIDQLKKKNIILDYIDQLLTKLL